MIFHRACKCVLSFTCNRVVSLPNEKLCLDNPSITTRDTCEVTSRGTNTLSTAAKAISKCSQSVEVKISTSIGNESVSERDWSFKAQRNSNIELGTAR